MGAKSNEYKFQCKLNNADIPNDSRVLMVLLKPIRAYNLKTHEIVTLERNSKFRYVQLNDLSRYYFEVENNIERSTSHELFEEEPELAVIEITGLIGIYKAAFWVVKEELEKYSMYSYEHITFTITRSKQNRFLGIGKHSSEAILEFDGMDFGLHYKYEKAPFYGIDMEFFIVPRIVDFFCNFEQEIMNAFGNSVFDTLMTIKKMYNEGNSYLDEDVFVQSYGFINEIYETVIEMGEPRENFKTIDEYLEERNERIGREKEAKQIKKDEDKEKRDKFLKELQYRQELLKDFNKPIVVK